VAALTSSLGSAPWQATVSTGIGGGTLPAAEGLTGPTEPGGTGVTLLPTAEGVGFTATPEAVGFNTGPVGAPFVDPDCAGCGDAETPAVLTWFDGSGRGTIGAPGVVSGP